MSGRCSRPPAAAALGLAIDIGTTTVAAQLVDLDDGSRAGDPDFLQPADPPRRRRHQPHRLRPHPERLAELRGMVLETINGLVAEMRRTVSSRMRDIRAAFIAGNTTMIHLLLGLPPRYIREAPYVPTVNPVPALTAQEVGLEFDPGAVVALRAGRGQLRRRRHHRRPACAPSLPNNREEVFLFLDIGTNGEIVIGNADWMVACACSAGPAFEGAGIKCGMRAAEGAIERVAIGPGRCNGWNTQVIGGGKPAGICGSGLICLLGELFRPGVDRSVRPLRQHGSRPSVRA